MKKNIITVFILAVFTLLLMSGCEEYINKFKNEKQNTRPVITLKAENTNPKINTTQTITAEIVDPDEDDEVTVTWTASAGVLSQSTGLSVQWTAPGDTVTAHIVATARDLNDGVAHKEIILYVGNGAPVIASFTASAGNVVSGNSITLDCAATDPEGGNLTYQFYCLSGVGTITQEVPGAATATWISPANIGQGEYLDLVVKVTDTVNFVSTDTLQILVYSNYGSLWLVDSDYNTVAKYTSNGYKILTANQSFKKPVAVVSNIDELSGCFVADQAGNTVYKLDYNGEKLETYSNIPHVIDIALYQAARKLFALSYSNSTVTVIDERTGAVEKTITGFYQPTSIEMNQWTGDVWVIEEGNNRIIQLNVGLGVSSLPDAIDSTTVVFNAGFNAPHQACIHYIQEGTITNRVYVTDVFDNQIERFTFSDGLFERNNPVEVLSPGPSLIGVLPVNLVRMILVVHTNGLLEMIEEENTLMKYPLTGNYTFIKPQVLAIDENTGECWVGDNGSNQLVKIKIKSNSSFTVLRKLDGFLSIKDISINK